MKEIIERIANRELREYGCTGICPKYLEALCEINNWKFDLDPNDYNGWEVDYKATITIDNTKIVHVSGTMYNGTANFYFE